MELGVYRHFKGNLYRVLAVATHTENEEKLVIYENQEGRVFARPYGMFNESVIKEGKEYKRFEKVSE